MIIIVTVCLANAYFYRDGTTRLENVDENLVSCDIFEKEMNLLVTPSATCDKLQRS